MASNLQVIVQFILVLETLIKVFCFLLGYVSDGDVLQYDFQSKQTLTTDPGYMSEGPVYNDSK